MIQGTGPETLDYINELLERLSKQQIENQQKKPDHFIKPEDIKSLKMILQKVNKYIQKIDNVENKVNTLSLINQVFEDQLMKTTTITSEDIRLLRREINKEAPAQIQFRDDMDPE